MIHSYNIPLNTPTKELVVKYKGELKELLYSQAKAIIPRRRLFDVWN